MKRLLRSLALGTLGLFVGLVLTETFHGLAKGHTEAQCAVCQIGHQTPVASQGGPVLHHQASYQAVSAAPAPVFIAQARTLQRGRSPPRL